MVAECSVKFWSIFVKKYDLDIRINEARMRNEILVKYQIAFSLRFSV